MFINRDSPVTQKSPCKGVRFETRNHHIRGFSIEISRFSLDRTVIGGVYFPEVD